MNQRQGNGQVGRYDGLHHPQPIPFAAAAISLEIEKIIEIESLDISVYYA
jgi:hypothetical protein